MKNLLSSKALLLVTQKIHIDWQAQGQKCTVISKRTKDYFIITVSSPGHQTTLNVHYINGWHVNLCERLCSQDRGIQSEPMCNEPIQATGWHIWAVQMFVCPKCYSSAFSVPVPQNIALIGGWHSTGALHFKARLIAVN